MCDTITFAKRVGAKRTLLFHHDPLHTDSFLDDLHTQARDKWSELGGDPAQIEIAREREELIVGPAATVPAPASAGTPVEARLQA